MRAPSRTAQTDPARGGALAVLSTRALPSLVVALLVVAIPPVFGIWAAPSYVIFDPEDHFAFSLSNLLPLVFSFLAALLYVPVILQETRRSGWMPIVARRGMRGYLRTHLVRSASVGAVAFGGAIAVAACLSLVILPGTGMVTYYPEDRVVPFSEQMTFTQLAHYGTAVYVAFMVVWVAVHGALITSLCAVVALHLPNPFLALLAVPGSLFLLDTVLALVGLEEFATDNAALPTALAQGSALPPVVTTVMLAGLLVAVEGRALRAPVPPAAMR